MAEDVPASVLKKTQEVLGAVIKKPPLTEKNLKRPPFRFLHDIITNVVKSTGFMKGLYTSDEMLSENVKDKETKIAFLQKAIDLLSVVTNQPVNLKPTKVVAGHEAQKTNEFLQLLAATAKGKVDTKEAVQAILQKSSPANPKERRASVDKRSSQKNTTEKSHARSTTKTIEPGKKPSQTGTGKEEKSDKSRSRSKESKSRDKTKEKSRSKREDSKSRGKSDAKKEKGSRSSRDAALKAGAEEPTESPKKTAFVQNGYAEDHDVTDEPDVAPVDNVVDGDEVANGEAVQEDQVTPRADITLDANNEQTQQPNEVPAEEKRQHVPSAHHPRPPSARSRRTKLDPTTIAAHPEVGPARSNEGTASPLQRPPSARPSSSRPAPPRIRIRHIVENEEPSIRPETAKPVENVIVDQKQEGVEDEDDETFVVSEEQQVDVLEPPIPTSSLDEVPDEDKGSLVKQILETKRDLEGGSQLSSKKVEVDKSQAVSVRAREASSKELEQLQTFIQGVSKTAYPLGRMLDYLQEDVDSMKMELRMWQEEHKQNLAALRKEHNVTETILQPLRIQLDDLDQLVQDQLDANSALKATILRNEERIQRMLVFTRRKS